MENYTIIQKLGQGKFGTVYMAKHNKTFEKVAVKCESVDNAYKSIKHEATILNYLYRCKCRCIPRVLYYGIYKKHICLVMRYFDISWEDYMTNAQINTKQLNRIMVCAIKIMQSIHEHGILHRDIKPANFMLCDNQLFLIDFGMATSFTGDFNEAPFKEHIIGSPKYVSYYLHCGYDSRIRDDMISLGYSYMSLLKKPSWCIENIRHTDIPYTHIQHPDNLFRKDEKSLEKIKNQIDSQLLQYFEHCYSAKNNVDYEFLYSIFL